MHSWLPKIQDFTVSAYSILAVAIQNTVKFLILEVSV